MFAIIVIVAAFSIFAFSFLHAFVLIHAMLAWFALSNMRAAETVALFFVAGVLIGYILRTAIASEVSKFKLSMMIASLENVAKEDAEKIREEVSAIAADLRKHL